MRVWKDVDDVQLLKNAQGGEAAAFGELYERYVQEIFRFLYAHLNNRLDAEDLTEEVFLRVWRALPKYRENGTPFPAYLYRVAYNALVDHYRRSKNTALNVELEDAYVIDNISSPEETLVINQDHQELYQVLEKLRDDYRQVLVLRFLSELSPEETAQVMERSVGAVRVLQHRALSKLKKLVGIGQDK